MPHYLVPLFPDAATLLKGQSPLYAAQSTRFPFNKRCAVIKATYRCEATSAPVITLDGHFQVEINDKGNVTKTRKASLVTKNLTHKCPNNSFQVLTLYGPNSFFRRFSGHNLR